MKKQQTLISAEEQHLAEMSKANTATMSTTVKKVKKSSKSSVQKSISTSSSIEEDTFVESISQDSRKSKPTQKLKKIHEQTKEESSSSQALLPSGGHENVPHEIKKKTKSRKSKKSEANAESISVKSSFSKFDALQKQNLLHDDKNPHCKLCSKPVYKMEEIKAEKNVYHKNCFKCHECSKQLKVDNYESHEGHPYCMIHFKLLFAPKAVDEIENDMPRKPELIIRENEPLDLPPDVVRASDVPDLGLDDLHQLNVRSRFQVFEKASQQQKTEQQLPTTERPAKRSDTILSKVARLQAHGFSDSIEGENIVNFENNSTDADDSSSCVEEDGGDGEDVDLVRSKKRTRERPVGIGKAMDDIKTKFEKGPLLSKNERREERKQEIQNIRSRLFMGKQARIKEMYQQAVADSEQAIVSTSKKPEVEIDGVTRSIKERFEKGEIFNLDNVVEGCDEKLGDIKSESSDINEKFKFFESYRPSSVGQKKQFRITPPRDGVVKMPDDDDNCDEEDHLKSIENNEVTNLLESSRTTAKMLDKFRELEKNKNRRQEDNGPKPLKCFTPPPDGGKRVFQANDSEQESEECTDEESSNEEDDEDAIKRSKLADDEALREAKAAARAKQLRAKFEKWEVDEIQREMHDNRIDIYSQTAADENIESTKSIRERFENMKTAEARNPVRPRYQVNRFV